MMENKGNLIHGMARRGVNRSKEYNAWDHMKQRCNNPQNHAYKGYGGRGIKVCDRWYDFECFLEDMGKAPSKFHSLDRIDNNGNYEPANCRWATISEQNSNKRTTILFDYNGVSKSIDDWARHIGMDRTTFRRRLNRGWPLERAILTPAQESGYSKFSR